MRRWLLRLGAALLALVTMAAAGAAWYLAGKRAQRDGELPLAGLQAPVTVRWDEAGVPHIRAEHEADLYRALGYLHAQDRLFQMEMVRRLARGELAEILGPKLVDTDRLFRTLGIRAHADAYAARHLQADTPATRTLAAYLDGINQYQATRPAPMEFDLLGIPKRPFVPADVVSVAGYLAYTFAAALRTEPALTHVRDTLGPDYLRIFDLPWQPEGAQISAGAWQGLARVAALSDQVLAQAGVAQLAGSNAWAVSGKRTDSGKPLLAGDPHIGFSVPAVWWEAHLQAPGFELYGHFQALNPSALLGHNTRFGWSLTMFQNDDMDLVAEKTDPSHPGQVFVGGQWVALQERIETIAVKGAEPVRLVLRRSPHGPIINEALGPAAGSTPVAMWWAFLETENPVLEAFYELNRADTLAKARAAAAKIHAPGLNVVWANADGDIGWWAAAQLPMRPAGVDPSFILDGSTGAADKPGFLPFSANPHAENPAGGHVMSANQQPASPTPVPGYYNLRDRAQRLQARLADPAVRWSMLEAKALQLDVGTGYAKRVLSPLLPALRTAALATTPGDPSLVQALAEWDGRFTLESVPATVYTQFLYELAHAAVADEMGPALTPVLMRTRAMEEALPQLAAQADAPWWDRRDTPEVETRDTIVALAWGRAVAHLRQTLGENSATWTWARAHTLTHVHPLGRQAPLDRVFNVGPFPVPGTRETPNFMAGAFAPAPWSVNLGPSTRRVIDFGAPEKAEGINPVGQSGVLGDAHYADQAERFILGQYRPQHLAEADVAAATRSTLVLRPR